MLTSSAFMTLVFLLKRRGFSYCVVNQLLNTKILFECIDIKGK